MRHQEPGKRRYVGARWNGSYPVRILGYDCNPGDVCTVMTESQAVASPQWAPVYETDGAELVETPDAGREEPNAKRAARRGKEA